MHSGGSNGIIIITPLTRWKEYTENLYKREENITEFFKEVLYQKDSSVREEEVRKVMNEIKNNKALG